MAGTSTAPHPPPRSTAHYDDGLHMAEWVGREIVTTGDLPIVDTVLWQVGLAGFSAIAGAVTANYVLPGKRTGTTYSVTGNTFQDVEHVAIGDTNLTVSKDNRVFITAAAVRAIAEPEPLREVEQEERRTWRRQEARRQREHEELRKELERVKRQRSSSTDEDAGEEVARIIFIVVGLLVAVVSIVLVYAWYREPVTTAIRNGATVVLAFALSGLITAAVRKVKLDRMLRLQVVVNVAITVAALLALNWLTDPPSMVDRANYERLLALPRTSSVGDVIEGFDQAVVLAVFYQLVGLVLLTFSLLLVACHTVMVFAVLSLAARVRADPGFQVGRTRRSLLRMFGGPGRCWWYAVAVSTLSLILMGGFAATYVTELQQLLERRQTSSTPATRDPTLTPD